MMHMQVGAFAVSNFAAVLERVISSRSPVLRNRVVGARDQSRADIVLRVSFANARDTVHARVSESSFRDTRLPLLFIGADIIQRVDLIEEARIAIRDLVDQ